MPEAQRKKLKLMFHSMEGTGHLNATLGLAQIMAKNGHEIVFVVNESLTKAVEKFGFRVAPLKQETADNAGAEKFVLSENPAADFAKQLQESGLLSGKTPAEKMDVWKDGSKFMDGLVTLMIAFNPQIEKLLEEEKPDVWLHDHFLYPPAVLKAKIPWVLIASAAPLMYYQSELLPPPGSGLTFSNRDEWHIFTDNKEEHLKRFRAYQEKVNDQCDFVDEDLYSSVNYWRSPYLNLYQYPTELDWTDVEGFTIPETFAGVDAFVRQDPGKFELPAEFISRETGSDKMIYLSMGSMGSFDIEMMQRILNVLAKLPYKVIVSKGPRGGEYELPANCWGENFLPQPEIVEMVDMVMTHGGNNSFTEIFAAGKPMIVMPLFVDQYDNAQRVHETGYGIRMDSPFTDQQLVEAVEKLMNDEELHERLEAVRKRVETSDRRQEVCRRIEELCIKN